MSDPQTLNQDLPPPLRALPPEQLEALRQFFIQGVVCPRCEWPAARQNVQPSEEDKKAFLRAVLGDGQFGKTYPLYDGKLKLGFSSLTTAQSLVLSEMGRLVPGKTPYEQSVELFRLKLLFYLTAKNDETFVPPAVDDEEVTFKQVRAEYLKRFGKWNEALLALALRTLQEFIRLEDLLMNGGLDKAFWKSAGLV